MRVRSIPSLPWGRAVGRIDGGRHDLSVRLLAGYGLVTAQAAEGRRGIFYEAWEFGGPEWCPVRVTATECPRIDQVFLQEERGVPGRRCLSGSICAGSRNTGVGEFDRDIVEAALEHKSVALPSLGGVGGGSGDWAATTGLVGLVQGS